MVEWRYCDLHPDINPDRHWGCADCMAEARRELRNMEAALQEAQAAAAQLAVMNASLRARFDGFREGVRIGMEYTRKELAFYRARESASLNPRPSSVKRLHAESVNARGGERMS